MKRLPIAVPALVALLLALPAQAQDDTLKKIRDSGVITLGYRESSIPFSYLDDRQKPVGFSVDLCARIVDGLKADLKLPALQIRWVPVTSASRILLVGNGTVDMECGSTTHTPERQRQAAFLSTVFIGYGRFVAKKSAGLDKLEDLRGRAVASTSGTTSLKRIMELNKEKGLGLRVLPAKDHAEGFLLMETGRAAAFVMDDVLLHGLVATSRAPGDYAVSSEALTVEPYAIMVRQDDPAFRKAADDALRGLFKSGEFGRIYARWFTAPVPPRGINLTLPMSPALKRIVAAPTDSGDPAAYR